VVTVRVQTAQEMHSAAMQYLPTATHVLCAAAVADYRQWIMQPEQAHLRDAIRTELRGKDLACWCPPDQPCHADVLLELANG
jgi:phosphopantothenoylcysteine synthetase/decarboxylase